MVEYKTIKSEEKTFGKNNNNFIEVARKKAITDQGETEFISIARGFIFDGQKRYKKSFTVPDDKEIVDFVTENLKKMI